MESEKIARINALARKKRTEGLTTEEKTEQQILRTEYLQAFRENLKEMLESIVVENPDGVREPLPKKPQA
ncbi:MAG: DUF896 domain-containing protein [Clostridia bacterium]